MKEQGWDLPPLPFIDPAADQPTGRVAGGWFEPDEEDSYGITTGISLDSAEDTPQNSTAFELIDQFRSKLSEREQELFDKHLYGGDDVPGCETASLPQEESAEFDKLAVQIELAEARISADPEIVEAWPKWSKCIEEKTGIDVKNQGGVIQHLIELSHQVAVVPDGLAASDDQDGDGSELAEQPTMTVTKLAKLESEIAAADRKCFTEHVERPYLEVSDRIYKTLDQKSP